MFSTRSFGPVRSLVASAAGCLALIALSVASAAAASPPPQVTRFHVGVDDRATAVVTDAAGNFYVGGYSQRNNTPQTFTVVKHNPQGGVVWTARYSGRSGGDGISKALALAIGPDGSVYATGFASIVQDIFVSRADILTVKFNSSGVEEWSRKLGDAGSLGSSASEILVDSAGNAYVSGNIYGQGYDWLTIKYSPSGAILWQRTLSGAGAYQDTVSDTAFDADGNVVVTGTTQNRGDGETGDITTVKYDLQGALLWRADFTETAISHEVAVDLDADADGNVYVTGTSADDVSPYTIATPRTLEYNRGGGLVLTLRDTAAGGSAIDVDVSGNIFVTGFFSPDINTAPTGSVAKFDALGNRVWVTPVPFGAILVRLAVTADGSLYGAGGGGDYLTVRFDASGRLVWQDVYNGTGNRDDAVADLAVDGAGNVFVTGFSWGNYTSIGGTGHDMLTLKYSNGGNPGNPGNPGNQPLQAPGSVRATAVTTRLVTVDWQDTSGAESGFRVERCQGARCTNFAQVGQVGPNATTFSDASVVRNTTYRYRVRAFDASAESPSSNVATATTPRR